MLISAMPPTSQLCCLHCLLALPGGDRGPLSSLFFALLMKCSLGKLVFSEELGIRQALQKC